MCEIESGTRKCRPQYVLRVNAFISRSVRTPKMGMGFELFRFLNHCAAHQQTLIVRQTNSAWSAGTVCEQMAPGVSLDVGKISLTLRG